MKFIGFIGILNIFKSGHFRRGAWPTTEGATKGPRWDCPNQSLRFEAARYGYKNIIMDDAQDARAYIAKIFSFPTTIIVDKNGNIVGQPILGNIEDEQKQEQIVADRKSVV